jgi:hypothetical protein
VSWSGCELPLIDGDWQGLWTTAEAAALLGPPVLTERQVREMVRQQGVRPAGRRKDSGASRRYLRVYRVPELIRAYDALATPAA